MLIGVRFLFVVAAVVLTLTACSVQFDESMKNLDNDKVLARLKSFQTKAGFDFSKIVVARLAINGEKIKVTSLRTEKISGFKDKKGEEAMTIALFNETKDALILFTRDASKKIGFEVELPLADFENKKEILFPVADFDSKTVVNKTVSLINIASR